MKAGDKITQKNRYIYILEVFNGWVTYHIYYGLQVWVKKEPIEKFQKKYLVEHYESISLF